LERAESDLPHPPQNLSSARLLAPHTEQVTSSAAPHWPQKLRPSAFALPQDPHSTRLL